MVATLKLTLSLEFPSTAALPRNFAPYLHDTPSLYYVTMKLRAVPLCHAIPVLCDNTLATLCRLTQAPCFYPICRLSPTRRLLLPRRRCLALFDSLSTTRCVFTSCWPPRAAPSSATDAPLLSDLYSFSSGVSLLRLDVASLHSVVSLHHFVSLLRVGCLAPLRRLPLPPHFFLSALYYLWRGVCLFRVAVVSSRSVLSLRRTVPVYPVGHLDPHSYLLLVTRFPTLCSLSPAWRLCPARRLCLPCCLPLSGLSCPSVTPYLYFVSPVSCCSIVYHRRPVSLRFFIYLRRGIFVFCVDCLSPLCSPSAVLSLYFVWPASRRSVVSLHHVVCILRVSCLSPLRRLPPMPQLSPLHRLCSQRHHYLAWRLSHRCRLPFTTPSSH